MINVALNIDGPRDPQYLLEVAEAVPQAVRVMNHLTSDHAALRYPSEANTLLSYLSAAAAGYPQLLGQVNRWFEVEQAVNRIRVAGGEYDGRPASAVLAVRVRLDAAAAAAEALYEALAAVTSVTHDLAFEAGENEQAAGTDD